jgi:hypothetical protein
MKIRAKLMLLGILLIRTPGIQAQVTKVIDNGSDVNRKVIAIFGDGYDAAHQTQFNTDVDNLIVKGAFGNDFFHENQDAFNVYRINLNSVANGVSTRTYNDNGTPSDPSDDQIVSTTMLNTRFRMIYSGSWAHCWMEGAPETEALVNQAISTYAPNASYVVFLMNHDGFGGCGGGGRLTVTRGVDWTVVGHEMGHGIGGLMDEYTAGRGAYNQGPINGVNCTTERNGNASYWRRFIDPATPVPTLITPVMDRNRTVGGFEGCGTYETQIFRPAYECRMNGNTSKFCPVCYTHMRKLLFANTSQNFAFPTYGDFTGDGKTDVMLRQRGGVHLYKMSAAPYSLELMTVYNKILPPTLPVGAWPFSSTDQFYPGDFNGDGKTDLLVYEPIVRVLGLLTSTGTGFKLSFRYNQGNVGPWILSSDDKLQVGDFNGDKLADVFISTNKAGGSRAGIFVMDGGGLTNTMHQIGSWPGWTMAAGDKYRLADFDGDGKTDVYAHNVSDWNGTEYLGMLKSNGATLSVIKTYPGAAGGWTLAGKDALFVGDFDGDKKSDLYIWNDGTDWGGVPYLGMLRSTGATLSFVKGYSGQNNPVGLPLRKSQEYWVADVNKDGKEDLVHRNAKDWGGNVYLGVYLSSGTTLSGVWRENLVGTWPLTLGDRIQPAAYDGLVGKSGLYLSTISEFGLLRFTGGNFQLDRPYYKWIYTALYDRYPWSDGFP